MLEHDGEATVLDLAIELVSSVGQPEVVRRILERALRVLGADRATLSRLEPDRLVIEATVGESQALTWVGRSYPRDAIPTQPLVERALREQRPILGGRLDADHAEPEFRAALASVRHTAVIPLIHAGAAVGLLVVSRERDVAFDASEARVMELLGGVAGLALSNAMLFHEVEETARSLRSAVAAAEAIASATDVDTVLETLLRHAVGAADADEGTLLKVDGGEAVVEASTGAAPAGKRFPLPTVTERAMVAGEVAELTMTEYLDEHPSLAGDVPAWRRMVVIPLRVGGSVAGLLALGRRDDRRFAPGELRGVQQLIPLAALLVRNARLLDEAREADRAKAEYVTMAVHELRAPVTVIRGYTSMLKDGEGGPIPPTALAFLDTMLRTTEKIAATVDEMLTAARLEERSVDLHLEPLDPAEALCQAAARNAARAELSSGRIEVGATAEGPISIIADARWLARILDNLIVNAIAHSDRPPQIRLSAAGGEGGIAIRVEDEGSGIPPELRESIFDRFVRGPSRAPGSGLGLYIGRGLARLMDGDLVLERTGDEGSSFCLRLPAG